MEGKFTYLNKGPERTYLATATELIPVWHFCGRQQELSASVVAIFISNPSEKRVNHSGDHFHWMAGLAATFAFRHH